MPEQKTGAAHFDNDAHNRYFERYTADYYWALKQWDFYDRYEGKVVVFYQREVLGVAEKDLDALAAAEAALDRASRPRPERAELVFVYYPPKCDVAIWDLPDYSTLYGEVPVAKED